MKWSSKCKLAVFFLWKNCCHSLMVLGMIVLFFWLLGRSLNTVMVDRFWPECYQELFQVDSEELYYLSYSRFLNQEMMVDNARYEEMYNEIRNLEDISWFGAYQYMAFDFDELEEDPDYYQFMKTLQLKESERFLTSCVRAVAVYADAWNLCRLECEETQEIENGIIPVLVGADLAKYFSLGSVYHLEGREFQVTGILKHGNKFAPLGYGDGLDNYIDLNTCLITELPSELTLTGSYLNFTGNVWFQIGQGADIGEVTNEIMRVLKKYDFHGWIKSYHDLSQEQQKRMEENRSQSQQYAGILMLLILCILFLYEIMFLQNRNRELSIWITNGITVKEMIQILLIERGIVLMAGLLIAGVSIWLKYRQKMIQQNWGNVVYEVSLFVFLKQTIGMMGGAGMLCLLVFLAVMYWEFYRKPIQSLRKLME